MPILFFLRFFILFTIFGLRNSNGVTHFFDIVTVVFQGNTLALHLLIICLDNLHRTSIDQMKDNYFTQKKTLSRRYPAPTIKDADNIVLLANIPTQAVSQQYSLEQEADGIGLHVDVEKSEYMCFNKKGDILTLNGGSLKLVNKFAYLGSSVSSTENNINMRLAKALTGINRLLVIWKSNLSDKKM